jgi:hypothetical protein
MTENLEILEGGTLLLKLKKGINYTQAQKIAKLLDENISGLYYIEPFSTSS